MNKNKAFTLVELLVVIAIIGLLSTIVLVTTKGMGDKARMANGLRFSQQVHNRLGVDAIGVWNFDEGSGTTVYDSSGYNYDGTIHGGAQYKQDTPSGKGYALEFDGVDDYVDTGINDNKLFHNGFTGSVWIKPEKIEDGSGRWIISKREDDSSGGFSFYQSSTYSQKVGVDLNQGGDIYSDNFLKLKNWHYVVFVIEPGNPNATVTFYADGKLSGQKQSLKKPITDIVTDNFLKIGIKPPSYYYKGLIDDVRIYAAPLTLAQIESLYCEGLGNLLAKGLMTEEEYQDKLASL